MLAGIESWLLLLEALLQARWCVTTAIDIPKPEKQTEITAKQTTFSDFLDFFQKLLKQTNDLGEYV